MSCRVLAACALVFVAVSGRAAEPKPLWEVDASGGEKGVAPAFLAFAPDGKAVVAVTVRETPERQTFDYKLRVWDAASRKERFTADLGRARTHSWGDELASFPSDTTVLTGGQALTVRELADGKQVSARPTGGLADHGVWAVPDLRETFHLRRDPDRAGKPVELFYSTQANQFNQFDGGGFGGRIGTNPMTRATELRPPRDGLRPQSLALNAGRTHLATAFRDDAPPAGKPRHSLALYRLKTVEDYDLDVVAEATNPHPGPVSALAFARNGRTLVTGGEDGTVCLWDVKDVGSAWKPRATVTGAYGRVAAVAFSPDWRYVVAVTWDKTRPNLYLIDADSGTLVRSLRADRDLTAVAFSPDGRTVVTGGHSGKLQAWDAAALVKEN
jgi:WD40 repeat protein